MLKRLIAFITRPATAPGIATLYREIMAQARQPVFYETLGVPDTVDGRFDLLLLHVILVLRQMNSHGQAKQQLFDLMFSDMDRNLREMGVGDMSIGKKIKPMLAAFYGRAKAYESSITTDGQGLEAALQRNLYRNVTVSDGIIGKMSDYVQRCVSVLARQSDSALLSGQVEFATPMA